nr:MAG TPA: hypothetical protein [Caudoviricetes sp.]
MFYNTSKKECCQQNYTSFVLFITICRSERKRLTVYKHINFYSFILINRL